MHRAVATGRKHRRKSLTAKGAALVDRFQPEFPIWDSRLAHRTLSLALDTTNLPPEQAPARSTGL